jgi:hypothetical protein
MMDQLTTAQMVEELYSLRLQKSIIEKAEKSMLDLLKPLVDPTFDIGGLKPVGQLFGDYLLQRSPGSNSRISADLLLGMGIPQSVIDLCTNTTPYFSYKVTAKSDKEKKSK